MNERPESRRFGRSRAKLAPRATMPPRALLLAALLSLAAASCTLPSTNPASCACTQGSPATCTYPPGTSSTVGVNFVNPCIDHWVQVGLATGYQVAVADPKVHLPFSTPSPSAFCFNDYCGGSRKPFSLQCPQPRFTRFC